LRGQTVEQWAPTSARFLLGRFSGATRFRSQRAQLGHLVELPHGTLDPKPAGEPDARPSELADLELLEVAMSRYQGARLRRRQRRSSGTLTATLRVSGRAFALLAPRTRGTPRGYGAVLAALARDDSPVRRITWIERTLPADADAARQLPARSQTIRRAAGGPPDELISYLQLIGRAGDVAEEHELLFSLQIDTRRPWARRAITRMGGGDLGALAVLATEVGQLIELLDEAGSQSQDCLTRAGLAAAIRSGYDPWGHRQRQRQLDLHTATDPGIAPHTMGPDIPGRVLGRSRSTARCTARCG